MRANRRYGAALAVIGLLVPASAAAQLGNPVPQSVGLGGNYVASAHGFGAVSWNPAGLGMPENPMMSFSILPLSMTAGLDPITPADFAEFDGQIIPTSAKEEWLTMIQQEGGESGNFAADVTYLGLSLGRIGLQASSSVRARVNVAPDVAEVFLFGNAGVTGDPGDYDLEGSEFDVVGTTTVAVSYAQPLNLILGSLPFQSFAVGVTLKYTVGNFLILGQEDNSTITDDPLEVNFRFPMIHTSFPDSAGDTPIGDVLNNGTGIGLDLGAMWQGGIFSAGVAVKNVVNTFKWDTESLDFRAGTATWNADTTTTSFNVEPIGNAPNELTRRVEELYTFSPILSAGLEARVLPFLTVMGEVRHSLEDNLDVGTRNHLGVGAELTIIPFIPLRAGLAVISGGYQLSGGAGLRLGPIALNAAAALREAELGSDAMFAAGLTFGLR